MSSPEKSKHWKSLAALLGTATNEESEEASAEVPAAPAPSPPVAAKPAPAPPSPPPAPRPAPKKQQPAPRRESHWGKLANVLGLAGAPPEPEIPAAAEEAVPELPPAPLPSAYSSVSPPLSHTSEAAAMAASHWDAPAAEMDRVIDPLEMVSEPFVDEAFDAVDLESIGPSGAARETGSDQVAEERRRRRRRRRGRGRGRQAEEEPASRAPDGIEEPEEGRIVPAEAATDSVIELDADFEEVPEVEPSEPAERSVEDDEGRRRRRRRRRGRRGRREEGRGGESEVSQEGEDRAAQSESVSARREAVPARPERVPSRRVEEDLDEEEPIDDLGHDDDLDEDRDEKGDDLQFSHKKIPSWYEAIESVIATNMASRASNPSSNQRHRGRGRRDR